VCRSGSQMRVCESHATLCSLDSKIAFLRTRLPWEHTALSTFGCTNLFLCLLCLFIHDILEERFAHLCHHGICNERHVFVLPRCVKGTTNVYEFIRYRWYIEDWSVTSTLSSVSHEGIPYFLVKWGQDPHGLLLQTIIGRR
jgi:hypothetical protein